MRAYPSLPPARAGRRLHDCGVQARRAGRDDRAGAAPGRRRRRSRTRARLARRAARLAPFPAARRYAVAFARGLAAGGVAACAKHFPGLGSTSESTDGRRPVHGVVRATELAGFRAAVEAADVPCVMVSHAIYRRFGPRPASLEPKAYRLLREQGFTGVAITDELGVLGSARGAEWARRAVLAGADLVLFSSPRDARLAIDALVPLARRGMLDAPRRARPALPGELPAVRAAGAASIVRAWRRDGRDLRRHVHRAPRRRGRGASAVAVSRSRPRRPRR